MEPSPPAPASAQRRSTPRATGTRARSRSSCRASVARLSSRSLSALAVERGKPFGLLVELPLRRTRDAPERLDPDPIAVASPGTCDLAVEEQRVDRVRRLDVEDLGAMLLREDLRMPGMDEECRVPDRQEARRRGCVGIRERRAGQVDELLAVLAAEAPE